MSNLENEMSGRRIAQLPARWVRVLLGVVLSVIGLVVLTDVAFFTLVSAIFIGWMAVAAGALEIVHAFGTKGWGGILWQVALGVLYVTFGLALLNQPLVGAFVLTYVLALTLLASGIIRILISLANWNAAGLVLLISGLFGVLAGVIILMRFPASGAFLLGALLGIDLLLHGIGWLFSAWLPKGSEKTPVSAG
ncbi:MAG: HdeD family acid-resistance protein [Variibacter sp.]|uniref:HdeD family acid-resistance protein n=1 Tax=Pseudorhodoplanes sp. TaxID=1934341 RepID=UPI003D14ECC5